MPNRPENPHLEDDETWVVDHWLKLSDELIRAGRRSSEQPSANGNGPPGHENGSEKRRRDLATST